MKKGIRPDWARRNCSAVGLSLVSCFIGLPSLFQVAERVRDPYRVAWGLPWAKAVMASAPNAFLAFTPLVRERRTPRYSTKTSRKQLRYSIPQHTSFPRKLRQKLEERGPIISEPPEMCHQRTTNKRKHAQNYTPNESSMYSDNTLCLSRAGSRRRLPTPVRCDGRTATTSCRRP